MTISNELLSSTLHSIMKEETDLLYQSCPLLDLFNKLPGGKKVGDWGTEITEPVITTEHSQPTAFPNGGEEMDTAIQDVLLRMRFAAADIGQPIVIFRKEEQENKGAKGVVKILAARVKAALGGQRRAINTQLLAGSSVPGIAAGLNTLYGHAAGATGFLEGRVAASQVNVVGGLSKALGPIGLINQFQDCADDFSANGRRAMDLLQIGCRTKSVFGKPNLIIASEAMFANYKGIIFPGERWLTKDQLDSGSLDNMAYGKAVIEPDIEMPTHATDNFEASAYFLNTQAFYLAFWEGNEFDLGEFENLTGKQVGRRAILYTKLQLCTKELSAGGFLADGNTD